MQPFEYSAPTSIVFGPGSEQRTPELICRYGGSKVLLHYGSSSAEKSGLLGRITTLLTDAGILVVPLGGVLPNPRLCLVRRGVELCREEGVDLVLAVGGGSVIDSAKAIALGAANPGCDVWDFFMRTKTPERALSVGSVVTIAAAGSETSRSSVITNEEGLIKRGLSCEQNIPKFAVMNPELTYGVSEYQTACGIVDIMMHTLDRYFAPGSENEMTDVIAEGLLVTVMRNGQTAVRNPENYAARSELMWAGSLSHNGLTGLGRASDFSVHQLGHELSGKFDSAHGASLSAVFASWARHVYSADITRFARFARRVWGIQTTDMEQAALSSIAAAETFFMSLQMPTSIPQLIGRALREDEIAELAEKCTFFGQRTVGVFRPLERADIEAIYRSANVEP